MPEHNDTTPNGGKKPNGERSVEDRRRASAVMCIAEHLDYVAALQGHGLLTEERRLEQAEAIVAAVIALTRARK